MELREQEMGTPSKAERHAAIVRILARSEITTQDELIGELATTGITVTQATISRDIKELGLVKVPGRHGRYHYAIPEHPSVTDGVGRLWRAVREYVTGVACSGNLVVVRTSPGTAGTVAAAIDELRWEWVLATVAGDDTVLIVARESHPQPAVGPAGEIVKRLAEIRGESENPNC